MHCCCFTIVNRIVRIIFFLYHSLGHSCLCDILILTHFQLQLSVDRCWSCETHTLVYVNKTNVFFYNYMYSLSRIEHCSQKSDN
jgi:hypothetical protein